MDADATVSADDLWWSWAVIATRPDQPEGIQVGLIEDDHVLTVDHGDSWLRMQRLTGGRALLWGRTKQPPTEEVDVLADAPDWASSDAVWRSTNHQAPEFLAWYAHDEWDSNSPGDAWEDSLHLFDIMRTADRDEVRAARAGETDVPLLKAAAGRANLSSQGALRKRIRTQIHQQMRDAAEVPRDLPPRPMMLERWRRVSQPAFAFFHVVAAREGTVVPLSTVPSLPREIWTSLTNVLQHLYQVESGEDSGAWLLARVAYDGQRITLDRAFDSLPVWFDGKGPRLAVLTWEMRQRTSSWRPGWSRLLPDL